MSPVYESKDITREQLEEVRKCNMCAVCGGWLNMFLDKENGLAFVACHEWLRSHHQGIEREASRYEKGGLSELNINTRREMVERELGTEKTKALAKYINIPVGTMTKAIATEIVETLWGDAPPIEKTKAILLCQSYQLNPLMRHLYLVGYKRRDKSGNYIVDKLGNYVQDWSIQIGIGATRLMAQRKHNYSYLDMSPRKATNDEVEKILGDTADPNSIYGFVHIKDIDTKAEAFGLRGIPKNERIKGEEKGNTHLNMACIRAERLALDRQYPGEMPQGVEVVDERFSEADYRVVDVETGEIREDGVKPLIRPEGEEKIGEPAADTKGEEEWGETIFSSTKEVETKKIGTPPARPKRDPSTLKTWGQLFQAVWDDFRLSKSDALAELNVTSQEELTELPPDCYRKILKPRS